MPSPYFVPASRVSLIQRPSSFAFDPRPALTLIHGAAGSGKTTLMAQWARSESARDSHVVWVDLHVDDEGSAGFWTRVISTLRESGAVDQGTVFDALSLGGLDRRTRDDALRQGFAELGGRVLLLIDNYERVHDKVADDEILTMLERVPNVHCAIATRTAGELGSIRAATRIATRLVTASELAFSEQDTEELALLNGLEPGAGRLLHLNARGWPLATRALIVERQRGESAHRKNEPRSRRTRFVVELVRSLLGSRTPEERDFLLGCSLADEMSVQFAAELTGRDLIFSHAQFSRIEEEGLGTWQDHPDGERFSFLPLIGEALKREAFTSLDQETLRVARTRLAGELQYSRPMKSLEIAYELQDWQQMDDILRRDFGELLTVHAEPVHRVVERVPPSVVDDYLFISSAQLVHDLSAPAVSAKGQFARGKKILAAESRLRFGSEHGIDAVLNSTVVGVVHRLLGDGSTSATLAVRTLELLDECEPHTVTGYSRVLPSVLNQTSISLIYDEQYDMAIHRLATGRELARLANLPFASSHAIALLALACALKGDMVAAQQWIAECEAADTPYAWRNSYIGAGYRIAKAYVALDSWDAERALSELAELAAHQSTIEHWPIMAVADTLARLQLVGAQEASASLGETLGRARWRLRPVGPLRGHLTATRTDMLLFAGQRPRASSALSAARRIETPRVDLTRARLEMYLGNDNAARQLADAISWDALDQPRIRAEALLIKAIASARSRDIHDALDALEAAIGMLRQFELRLPLFMVPASELAQLIAQLAQDRGRDHSDLLRGMPGGFEAPPPVAELTAGELRVLHALEATTNTAELAAELFLSPNTVRHHLKSVHRKLGVNSRGAALARGHELGIMSDRADAAKQ